MKTDTRGQNPGRTAPSKDAPAPEACCSKQEQETCCQPSEKSSCCGPKAERREIATGDTREADARDVLHPGLDRGNDLACATECLTPLVQALPEPYRRAIERVELEGASQGDAARGEGLSLSGMKSRVQRARQRLSELLQERCRIALDARGGIASCDEPGDAGGAGGCCGG